MTTLIAVASAPTVVGLLGIILNATSSNGVRKEILATRGELHTDIRDFRSEVATELRAVRSDINMVTKMYGEHGERLATLEAKR